ncbi:MAG: GNAT family N-acetyltransferase [Candidatus Eremiobacteraeota bacterium]|nr:GNAT family N-acetyltransferase [Candidatus Eremiobacteraeota bacterium]
MSRLALRSKAYWGYDAAFMEMIRPSFAITGEYIEGWPVFLAEKSSTPIAFYGFRKIGGDVFLADMFVDPDYVRRGLGTLLWSHALTTAGLEAYPHFFIESDPNAEAFYLRLGCKRVGDIISADSGRVLPLLRYELASDAGTTIESSTT